MADDGEEFEFEYTKVSWNATLFEPFLSPNLPAITSSLPDCLASLFSFTNHPPVLTFCCFWHIFYSFLLMSFSSNFSTLCWHPLASWCSGVFLVLLMCILPTLSYDYTTMCLECRLQSHFESVISLGLLPRLQHTAFAIVSPAVTKCLETYLLLLPERVENRVDVNCLKEDLNSGVCNFPNAQSFSSIISVIFITLSHIDRRRWFLILCCLLRCLPLSTSFRRIKMRKFDLKCLQLMSLLLASLLLGDLSPSACLLWRRPAPTLAPLHCWLHLIIDDTCSAPSELGAAFFPLRQFPSLCKPSLAFNSLLLLLFKCVLTQALLPPRHYYTRMCAVCTG